MISNNLDRNKTLALIPLVEDNSLINYGIFIGFLLYWTSELWSCAPEQLFLTHNVILTTNILISVIYCKNSFLGTEISISLHQLA